MVQLAARPIPAPARPPAAPATRSSPWLDVLPFLILAGVGFWLRMHEVAVRAYHHDESLHAVYSWYLYVGRGYVHDPLMHGPFQFHMTALLYWLFGDNNVTARLAAVLFGTGIIVLPYFLRHELGHRGSIAASLLFTVSPSFLYFSRFAREDIYLAFFTLGMAVGIFGWVRTRNPRYLYFGSLMLILAFADKEATYIHAFVFLTFFVVLWATARLHSKWPTAWQALKAISRRTWIECIAIFGVVYVLLFTTFFTNVGDPTTWLSCFREDRFSGAPCGGLYSGSVGALAYWIDQHDVQRGGQPYYYYLLLIGLYEFVPFIFALAAMATRWFRKSLFGWFCAYWFVGNFVIYSWAGEKMPWLLPHVAMPLVLLAARWLGDWSYRANRSALLARPTLAVAGLALLVITTVTAFVAIDAAQALTPLETQRLTLERLTLGVLVLGALAGIAYLAIVRRARVGLPLTFVALLVLGSFYIRTAWVATYQNADVPLDMLIYVQSSPDVPRVVDEIERIGFQTAQRKDLRILMDNGYTEMVGGQPVVHEAVSWPFEWYLRDYKNRRYFTRTFGPDIDLRDYPVILAMAPNIDPIRDQLGDYVGQKYRLNWWFPEDYKVWSTNPGAIFQTLSDPAGRARFLKFLLYREPFNILGAREFYLFVRKDVPTLGPAPTTAPAAPGARPAASAPIEQRVGAVDRLDPSLTLFGVNPRGEPLLVEPKGIALAPDGRAYVAEGRGNRVTILNPDGSIAGTFGRPGTGAGEFAEPWGIAVVPTGEVYVADTWNHRIQKFAPDGRPVASWGGVADTKGDAQAQPGKFFGPRDIAIGPDGLLYVSDTGNKRIQVFDADGHVVRVFGGAGDEPGRFNEPVGLAFDGDTLLVADGWNGRIQRLDTKGNPLGAIPIQGWENRGITNKPYIAAAGGQIYVTFPERGEVGVIEAGGQVRPLSRPADGSGRLGVPTGVDVTPDGDVWVAESAGGTLSRYAVGGPR
ncbi:MAG: TIGR03663 family protein [Chloroflexota bacterium]|nr:TIGR03663 family protein [Chloroflexota bacterium]